MTSILRMSSNNVHSDKYQYAYKQLHNNEIGARIDYENRYQMLWRSERMTNYKCRTNCVQLFLSFLCYWIMMQWAESRLAAVWSVYRILSELCPVMQHGRPRESKHDCGGLDFQVVALSPPLPSTISNAFGKLKTDILCFLLTV